jgi:hypothetical protein
MAAARQDREQGLHDQFLHIQEQVQLKAEFQTCLLRHQRLLHVHQLHLLQRLTEVSIQISSDRPTRKVWTSLRKVLALALHPVRPFVLGIEASQQTR